MPPFQATWILGDPTAVWNVTSWARVPQNALRAATEPSSSPDAGSTRLLRLVWKRPETGARSLGQKQRGTDSLFQMRIDKDSCFALSLFADLHRVVPFGMITPIHAAAGSQRPPQWRRPPLRGSA